MGANYLKDETVRNSLALPSGDARRFSKHVHDNVHGNIYLDQVFSFLCFRARFNLFYLVPKVCFVFSACLAFCIHFRREELKYEIVALRC